MRLSTRRSRVDRGMLSVVPTRAALRVVLVDDREERRQLVRLALRGTDAYPVLVSEVGGPLFGEGGAGADDIAPHLPPGVFEERQADGRASLAATEGGLRRRSLFGARRPARA